MKKRILSISIVLCVLFSSTIVFAVGTTKVDAIISGMKMYFNGKPLKGNVITAKGITYVPLDILSTDLGFKLSSDSKSKILSISERVSKNYLLKSISELQNKNNELSSSNSLLTTEKSSLTTDNEDLKSQINSINTNNQIKIDQINASNKATIDDLTAKHKTEIDNLSAKLAVYTGTLPQGDGTFVGSPNIFNSYNPEFVKVYTNGGWNDLTPFKANGKIYNSKELFGISITGGKSSYWDNSLCMTMTIRNDNNKYRVMTFYRAYDELTKNGNASVIGLTAKTLSGTVKLLNYYTSDDGKDHTNGVMTESQPNGFTKYTVDISSLQEITIYDGGTIYENKVFKGMAYPKVKENSINFDTIYGESTEIYDLIQGPYVK